MTAITYSEVADLYDVDPKTLIGMLHEAGFSCNGKRVMPAMLSEIFKKLGHPDWSKKINPPLPIVKPCYCRRELAAMYGMSRSAFFERCRAEGLRLRGGCLPPVEVMRVFKCFGTPSAPPLVTIY
jgi:hypothetical protein